MIGGLMGLPGKVKTLIDRLTATRAANLDYLTATRAGYIDNLSGGAPPTAANYSATRAGYIDKLNAGGIPGTVKRVLRFTFSSTSYSGSDGSASNGYLTLDKLYYDQALGVTVDTSKTICYFEGLAGGVTGMGSTPHIGDSNASVVASRLVSSTQARISSHDPGAFYFSGVLTVIEYY